MIADSEFRKQIYKILPSNQSSGKLLPFFLPQRHGQYIGVLFFPVFKTLSFATHFIGKKECPILHPDHRVQFLGVIAYCIKPADYSTHTSTNYIIYRYMRPFDNFKCAYMRHTLSSTATKHYSNFFSLLLWLCLCMNIHDSQRHYYYCCEELLHHLYIMPFHPVISQLFIFSSRLTIICVRIDTYATTRSKKSCNFNIFRLHKAYKILHYHIHTILMKISMIAETIQIKFQTFTFHHFFRRNILYANFSEIRLSCYWAQGLKFRKIELNPEIIFLMSVNKCLQNFRIVICIIFCFTA